MTDMKEREISDNEIQVLGTSRRQPTHIEIQLKVREASEPNSSIGRARRPTSPSVSKRGHKPRTILIITVMCCVAAALVFFLSKTLSKRQYSMYDTVSFERENAMLRDIEASAVANPIPVMIEQEEALRRSLQGYVETFADTINDVPLIVYLPKNAVPELLVGTPDKNDSTIVFAARAADLGGNNYGIVGDFVYRGAPMGHGGRKEGYCAIIERKLTIGIDFETPLYKQSIDKKGFFFRQYPLVKNGEPIDNKPKGKAIRRALAIKEGTVMMFESSQRESFHDFACALSDYGVSEAIYLVGSTAYGWYRDSEGQLTTFGAKDDRDWQDINYLVWRR
jgi:hypothetical protein